MLEVIQATTRLLKLGAAIVRARWEARGLATTGDRALWQQRQARRMLAALDIRISVSGIIPADGMVVCNHLGYLDVLVIAAQGPMVFVAKSDVRSWPFVGPLLAAAGTILAQRGKPLTAGETGGQIRRALHHHRPVVLFPEGTSSDGMTVLPFKPTLLQAALDAGSTITPAAISYQADTGDIARDICYWGDALFPFHLAKLASLKNVTARLHFGYEAMVPADRKQAARMLHSEVSELLFGMNQPA
jgi:1-acyl-sn-glycerol-3-phosphate acyltransferase